MARINKDLLARLQKKLGVGRSRVYGLIDAKMRQTHLPRNLAAVAVASERGIGIGRYTTEADLAAIRQAAVTNVAPPVVAPSAAQRPNRRTARRATARRTPRPPRRRGNSVFVVHGRNTAIRDSIFQFLRSLQLLPIEWIQAIRMTGEPTPYVGTVLDVAFREAAAVVVLLTPDDEVRLKTQFRKRTDPQHERRLSGQARPNVLFEAGMAFGRSPENTVLVQVGEMKPFSDIGGRHVVHLANSPTGRQELATKLANAGCNVDTSGTDWLTVGRF